MLVALSSVVIAAIARVVVAATPPTVARAAHRVVARRQKQARTIAAIAASLRPRAQTHMPESAAIVLTHLLALTLIFAATSSVSEPLLVVVVGVAPVVVALRAASRVAIHHAKSVAVAVMDLTALTAMKTLTARVAWVGIRYARRQAAPRY
jgi:hypothetical protein